jgi:hypothetical protein
MAVFATISLDRMVKFLFKGPPGDGLSRGAHLHALSGQGLFRLWRLRVHCQGVRLIEMSDFLSEGTFSFLYLERWQITC